MERLYGGITHDAAADAGASGLELRLDESDQPRVGSGEGQRFRQEQLERDETRVAYDDFGRLGKRRRVEIARALATQPSFMLLDEPFAGIDPIAIGEIRKLVHHLKERGIGVLITDHNVRETLGICDRAYIVSEGRVLAEGTPAEIVENAQVRKVYLGEHFRM